MRMAKHAWGAGLLGVALLGGAGCFASPAEASFIVTLTESGGNVVANGTGRIDLTGLIFVGNGSGIAGMNPSIGNIELGAAGGANIDIYSGFTGPADFGTGGLTDAGSGIGDAVGVVERLGLLVVPSGYVSGDSLLDSATWNDATFASLGVTQGTYTWSWNSSPTSDDDFTLEVPEPSSLALLALPLGLLVLLSRRRTV